MSHIENLKAALDRRAAARAAHNPPMPLRNKAEIQSARERLAAILSETGAEICDLIAAAINDHTVTRVYLTDLKQSRRFEGANTSLAAFFKALPDYAVVDVMRDWLREYFGDRIRLEGDNRYASFSLEFE